VCTIQNHSAIPSLNNRTPVEWLLGYTPDITVFLQFQFWEPVYYAKYDAKFPADSTEALRMFVGIAENVGNAMTFKILTADGKIIHRSVVRSALKGGAFTNVRANSEAIGTIVEEAGSMMNQDLNRECREMSYARRETSKSSWDIHYPPWTLRPC
jgi:hypothetical protein